MDAAPVKQEEKTQETYFKLNNEINRPIGGTVIDGELVGGQIPLHKDKESAHAFFLEHVNPNMVNFKEGLEEKISYLIEHDYLERAFIEKYDMAFIKKLFKHLYGKKFRFKSFMGAYKFYKQYAMKTNDGKHYLEYFEDRIAFTALYLADGDEELAWNMAEEIMERRLQPATPTFLSSGKARRGELVSCFLTQTTDDMQSISNMIHNALMLSRIGGGVGNLLSNLRAAGDPIKGIENASSGVIPVMKLLEDSFSYSNQLGQRNGAGAAYLSIFHPDVIDFLSTKKENADEKIRIKTLSLGLVVPDKFYELVAKDEYMYLFSPYDVERIYGQPFAYVDITQEYDNMVNNPEIKKKKVRARELENEISKLQQESGYPYIINIDTVNEANPVPGKVVMSNLCSEILQSQIPSKTNEDGTLEEVGQDISCNLGSVNIMKMMETPDFEKSIRTAVRALTAVTNKSSIDAVPSVKNGNDQNHSIGLGAMGMHGFLANNQVHYDSEEAVEFAGTFHYVMNYWSLAESNQIAKETGKTFYKYEDSAYADGSYFEKYLNNDWSPKLEKVQELFKDIYIPTQEDWANLKESVQEYGVYHSYRHAVAP